MGTRVVQFYVLPPCHTHDMSHALALVVVFILLNNVIYVSQLLAKSCPGDARKFGHVHYCPPELLDHSHHWGPIRARPFLVACRLAARSHDSSILLGVEPFIQAGRLSVVYSAHEHACLHLSRDVYRGSRSYKA